MTEMNQRLQTVCAEAQRQNGWMVTAILESPETEGTVPHGVVMASRGTRPGDPPFMVERHWLTAGFACQPGVVLFQHGHYDLTRDEALEDYRERIR
jgi:hypothetical protein